MRQSAGVFFFVLVVISSVLGQSERLYVKEKTENLRTEPSGTKIGELLAGTKVEILERRPDWVKVQLTGWIWEKSLISDSTMVFGFTVGASHILLATLEEAKKILSDIQNGINFEVLARQYSIDKASSGKGGYLGEFSRGDLMPEFENAVFQLRVGQIGEIVKTSLGYHIVKRVK